MPPRRNAFQVGVQMLRASCPKAINLYAYTRTHERDKMYTVLFEPFWCWTLLIRACFHLQVLVLVTLLLLWNDRINLSQDGMGYDGMLHILIFHDNSHIGWICITFFWLKAHFELEVSHQIRCIYACIYIYIYLERILHPNVLHFTVVYVHTHTHAWNTP